MNCDCFLPGSWPDQVLDDVSGDAKNGIPCCGSLVQIPVPGFDILGAIGLFNKMGKIVDNFNWVKHYIPESYLGDDWEVLVDCK